MDMRWVIIPIFPIPIILAYVVSTMNNSMNWGEYEMSAYIWIPLSTTIFTAIFGIIVIFQFHIQRKQLGKQINELDRKNTFDTFDIVDKYMEKIFHDHTVIDLLLEEVSFKETYRSVSKFLDDVEELLDDVEVLALKVDRLGLEMFVVYEIIGDLVIRVCNHPASKNIKRKNRRVDSEIYVNLDILVKNLENEKQKRLINN